MKFLRYATEKHCREEVYLYDSPDADPDHDMPRGIIICGYPKYGLYDVCKAHFKDVQDDIQRALK